MERLTGSGRAPGKGLVRSRVSWRSHQGAGRAQGWSKSSYPCMHVERLIDGERSGQQRDVELQLRGQKLHRRLVELAEA